MGSGARDMNERTFIYDSLSHANGHEAPVPTPSRPQPIIEYGLMAVPAEILLHDRIVRRIRRAMGVLLQSVRHGPVVGKKLEAGVVVWMVGPRDELVPIPALHDLIVTDNVWLVCGRHGRVVGFAHEVLAEHVEAVVDVFFQEGIVLECVRLSERLADDFLLISSAASPRFSTSYRVPDSGAGGRP